MNKLISGYLWAWKNWQAGSKSVSSLKKYYPDTDIFINVDYEGDIHNYKKICENNKYIFSQNSFQVGYCGNHNENLGYECWTKEKTFEWVKGIYNACKKTDSKYIILLEEDDFILKPISILETDFSMAIHPTDPSPIGCHRPNYIPHEYTQYIINHNGNPFSPGYAAGGGTIFNREHFIFSWENHSKHLWENFDSLKEISKIIGLADYILLFIIQLGGFEIIQNEQLCEHWEVKDYWNKFEIVTGLKDIEIIKSI